MYSDAKIDKWNYKNGNGHYYRKTTSRNGTVEECNYKDRSKYGLQTRRKN